MTTPRDEILDRIRRGLGDRPRPREADYADLPRAYRQAPAMSRTECVDLFARRLADYDAGVHRCRASELRATVGRVLMARGRRRLVVPADLASAWLPDGFDFLRDSAAAPVSHEDLDRVDGALTGCGVGIALTGTLVLSHAAQEGRRVVTLIPDYHLSIVEEDRIVETVPEALRRIAARKPALVTTISGPSATADIEMTRIRGVHGPRTLDVVIVASAGTADR
jgi:L-lactate dehydrogenase complex protein LldG